MNKIIILLFLLLIVYSCKIKESNVDPNNLTGERLGLPQRLPAIEYELGRIVSGNLVKRIGNTTGQVIYRQGPTGLNNYVYTPSDASNINLWADIYVLILKPSSDLIELAKKEDAPVYLAIGKILNTIGIGIATSIWGDVPYSQINNPNLYPNPVFDTQESIYGKMLNNLNEAINLLNEVNATGVLPKGDDFIFNGNTVKWQKTAYALKARYFMHLVKINEAYYDSAQNALNYAYKSNEDNCLIRFQNGQPEVQAPLYLERTTTRDTEVDPVFGSLLQKTLKDPREKFYSLVSSSLYSGTRAQYGPLYAMPDSYFPIITYEEGQFLQTEIAMKKGGKIAAEVYLKEAMMASLARVCKNPAGSADSVNKNYVAAIPDSILTQYIEQRGTISSLSDEDAWKTIFQQKYIALFLQLEIWNDYRRTEKYVSDIKGLPVIKPRDGNQLPRRYSYSGNEINFNKNAPPNPGIFERIWWDVP